MEICEVETQTTTNWMTPIVAYLRDDNFPADKNEASSSNTKLVLSHKSNDNIPERHSGPLLKCLAKEYCNCVLIEIHEGIDIQDLVVRPLARKALRFGYY